MRATIGRIVHFYDNSIEGKYKNAANNGGLVDINGQGKGPYPALVIQVFSDDITFEPKYVNLRVFVYGGEWTEGSVAEYDENDPNKKIRYWKWPPRE